MSGFTLLELIVVLAGLGILSSLAIPNYMRYLDYAKVDEAKALLNSTAADCLQGLRRNSNRLDEVVDNNIISITRLRNTGYVFKDGADRIIDEEFLPTCRNVQITAFSEDDRQKRLPDLGFFLNNQFSLTKTATNSGSETKFPADSWAGANTTDEKQLIDWLKLNEAIAKEQSICDKNKKNFINNVGTGRTSMWDPVKTSKCTDKPPKFEDAETCTPNGCTKDVWYIDGEFCGYEPEDMRECERKRDNAICTAEKDKMALNNSTTERVDGDLLNGCNSPVWFFNGENKMNVEAWKPLMCKRNMDRIISKEPTYSGEIEYCDNTPIYIFKGDEVLPNGSREDAKDKFESLLDEDKVEKCKNALRNDAKSKDTPGPHTSPTPAGIEPIVPDDCGAKYWYCPKSGKVYKDPGGEDRYKEDPECKNIIIKPKPWWCPYAPNAPECQ